MILSAFSAFRLTVCETKTKTMCRQTKEGEKVSSAINAASHVKKQTFEFVLLGGAISANRDPR